MHPGRRLACALNLHKPTGFLINWDGTEYRSQCRHCKKILFRKVPRKWKVE